MLTSNVNITQPIASAAVNKELFEFKLQYSRNEAAEMLGISLRTLDRLIAEKQITVRRIGKRVLITRDTLNNFVRRDHQTGVTQ
jgi:excisionase family DNA binding protein